MPSARTVKAAFLAVLFWLAVWPVVSSSNGAPATAPARGKHLQAEAEKLASRWADRLGDGYITRIDSRRHIVYVSSVDKKALAHVVRLIGDYNDALGKMPFSEPARWNTTVILPTVRDYRRLVRLTGAHGLYNKRSRTLVSISFSNVLIHKFVHALHHNDQVSANQQHPIWLVEGLATLFQSSRLKDGKLKILTDSGLSVIQKAMKENKVCSLGSLCSMSPKAFTKDAKICYPQVRYVMLYLHRLGKLQQFYEAYKAGYSADRTGSKALERTLGKPLKQIEAEWRKWVLSQKPPWRPGYEQRAHLGVRMQKAAEGVNITGFVRNSTAQRAGLLKVGDVIISLAGQSVHSAGDLTAAVQSCKPGHIVDLGVIRDGRTVLIKHVLGLMPK